MPRKKGHRLMKYVDSAICKTAGAAFDSIQFFNKYRPNPSFTPKWSDKPLLKSWEKSKPTLGFPRTTDSLCPTCVRDAREKIINGEEDYRTLMTDKVGEIKAQIIERDGEVWMTKECPKHGKFEDMMAKDVKFLEWIEGNFPGRDIRAHNDERLHRHGSSTVKYGRGSVLTVDLTNRCNMMCDPCFMDANQVGYVHELSWEDIQEIMRNALEIKPRRQMSIQFSGGEPTMSPYFLKAVRYARELGYNSVQAATNGIEFAKSKEFARQAAEAGLRYAYLQFDGIGNDANSHRQIGNLFDVKLRAINNMHEAGIEIVLVTTLVNGVNNDQVGPIVKFAQENPKKIAFISFQPVSFTGRDEEITAERRHRQRYTLSHMASDVKAQAGITEPTRDWFPISLMGAFADFADLVHGPEKDWGSFSCGCHPNCGVGTAIMIHKETKEMAPVPQFINVPGLGKGSAESDGRCAQSHFLRRDDGLGAAEKLPAVPGAQQADLAGYSEEVRQDLGRQRKELRKVNAGPDDGRHPEATRGSVELPVHRGHVVPGSVQLRFPPHRNVHHPVRHTGRRDFILRVQHGCGLAEDHREHVQERHRGGVVQEARKA